MSEAYGKRPPATLEELLYTGFYTRIFDRRLNPSEASSFYVSTNMERDLRQVLNVRDLAQFEVFLKLCAGRTGQLLNLSSLGNDAGNRGQNDNLYFFRDSKGLEIDVVLDFGQDIEQVEIKSGKTLNPEFFTPLAETMRLYIDMFYPLLALAGWISK